MLNVRMTVFVFISVPFFEIFIRLAAVTPCAERLSTISCSETPERILFLTTPFEKLRDLWAEAVMSRLKNFFSFKRWSDWFFLMTSMRRVLFFNFFY